MDGMSDLGQIEKLCDQIMNSPYFRKQTPEELKQLHAVLEKVNTLIRDDVPLLMSEVRDLRNKNKKLRAEIETLMSGEQRDREVASVAAVPTPG
jgi:predicted  nucleic acid-binding Zn-ribbon protein